MTPTYPLDALARLAAAASRNARGVILAYDRLKPEQAVLLRHN